MFYSLKRREWVVFFAIVFISITAMAVRQMRGGQDDVTGTVSKVEPSTKQDGTPAHPYADAGQCPPSTDMIFWPKEGRSIPSIPPSISVCFVGDRSSGNGGPADGEVRDR
jgi:uncharacterized Zn-binding protein involved in type VI secretion